MPSDNIKKPQQILHDVQIQSAEVPSGKFISQEYSLLGVKSGQRIGLSPGPSGSVQTNGIHVMNAFCVQDGTLTIQFINIGNQDASVAAGIYTAYIDQGDQDA